MSLTRSIPFFLILTLTSLPAKVTSALSNSRRSNCPKKCGNITIPYPFGTKEGCYRPGFGLTCNDSSSSSPKLFLDSNPATNIQILNINLVSGEITALKFVGYRCFDKSGNVDKSENEMQGWLRLTNNPTYLFSSRRNKFTVIGCDALAYMQDEETTGYASGCLSFCNDLNSTTNGSCNGMGCCQTSIPKGLSYYNVTWGFDSSTASNFSPCIYATLVEEDWYSFRVTDLTGTNFLDNTENGVPFVIDWAIRGNGTCRDDTGVVTGGTSACVSKNSHCNSTDNGEGYLCHCMHGYEGNPYIRGGCKDINECKSPHIYHCSGTCKNTYGDYECPCLKGMRGDGKIVGNCTKIPDNFPYPARVSIGSILTVAVLVAVCFLIDAYQRRRRHNKEKEEHLKYYAMMASSVRVFSKKEIEKATNNFDENLVLGTGGHGKVYRGIFENNNQVAIKKSKEVEETKREEFVKEIILLSQINHKSIVRILGCCLEVEVPMLVYEFVPNGSLFDLLHGKRNNQSIPLTTRIKIALGSAEALDYLHNSVSRSIIHGDVKSANILLDDKNAAKVSDFGASNLVPTDATEFLKLVQGTRGYLDPECWSTQIITKSSDVYSFGVVLLELITRRKAIYTDENNEIKNLAASFVSMANKNKMSEILDEELVIGDEKVMEVLREVSDLALWCLCVKGDDRPTMTQVVQKLQSIVRFNQDLFERSNPGYSEKSFSVVYTAPYTATFDSTNSSSMFDIDLRNLR